MTRKIINFPTLYPDELLYSGFARYHLLFGNTSFEMTTTDLFGKSSVRSVVDLPSNLILLSERLDQVYSFDDLLMLHTEFPYYELFLLPSQRENAKNMLLNDQANKVNTCMGITASHIKGKEHLWYCQQCFREDAENYGEPYWHRVHQLPGVYICPKHKTLLKETVAAKKPMNSREYTVLDASVKNKTFSQKGLTERNYEQLFQIALMSQDLLSRKNLLPYKSTNLRKEYINLLIQQGYANRNGRVYREKLYNQFNCYFSEQLLLLLQSQAAFKETNWLTSIFQKHRKSFHPLRHILVTLFLQSQDQCISKSVLSHPFGNGPWLCLNPVCPHFHQYSISNVIISKDYKTGKPVGTFKCSCGFIYSRRGPDKEIGDKYKIGTIKEYGELWLKKIKQLRDDGNSYTSIAYKVGANRSTIRKYLAMLSHQKDKNESAEIPSIDNILECRKKWLDMQNKYSNKSKTELRRLCPAIYMMLYRHDQEWLSCHSSFKKMTVSNYKRIDWKRRDLCLLEQVKKGISEWDYGTAHLRRITVTGIGRKLNCLSLLEKKAEKLPLTIGYINSVKEDTIAFQKRRIRFVIQNLRKSNEPILLWQIYRKAGIRHPVAIILKEFTISNINQG